MTKLHLERRCDKYTEMETNTHPKTILEKILASDTVLKAQRVMRSRYGTSILAIISFLESFLPLPILTDPFLMAAIMVDRARTWRLVFVTMVSSVAGGFCAYLVAVWFRDVLFLLLNEETIAAINSFAVEGQGAFLLTIIGAITPVPYTVIAWAVALSAGNPMMFILGSVVGRSIRYGIVGWCTYKFGPLAVRYAKRSILWTSVVTFVLFGIYVWLKM